MKGKLKYTIQDIPYKIPAIWGNTHVNIGGDQYPLSPVAFFAPARKGYHMGVYVRRRDKVVIAYLRLRPPSNTTDAVTVGGVAVSKACCELKDIVEANEYCLKKDQAQGMYNAVRAVGGFSLFDVVVTDISLLRKLRGLKTPDHRACVGLAAWKVRRVLTDEGWGCTEGVECRRVPGSVFMEVARGQ